MTKRKIGIFCVMAGLVFAVSRGSQVRHASADVVSSHAAAADGSPQAASSVNPLTTSAR